MTGDATDPKGLIREAYRIDGITAGECRSIFLDWALSMPQGPDLKQSISTLLDRYSAEPDDHPMTLTLREGLSTAPDAKRRGGRRARLDRG